MRRDQVAPAAVEAEIPPEGIVDEVVGDALAERDPVRQVGREGVASGVVDGDALDDRATRAVVVGVEVDGVATEDLLVALPRAHVVEADVGQLLRIGRAQHDHVGAPLGRSAEHDVAGEVEHLRPVDHSVAYCHLGVRVVEGAVEADGGAAHRRDPAAVVVLPVILHVGRLRRRDDDLVAHEPAGGVVDGDRPVAAPGAAGEVGPRPFGRALQLEDARSDGPQADVGLQRRLGVSADEARLVDPGERQTVHDRGGAGAHDHPAGDDDVAGGGEVAVPRRVEREAGSRSDLGAGDDRIDIERDLMADGDDVTVHGDLAAPRGRSAPRAVGHRLRRRRRGRRLVLDVLLGRRLGGLGGVGGLAALLGALAAALGLCRVAVLAVSRRRSFRSVVGVTVVSGAACVVAGADPTPPSPPPNARDTEYPTAAPRPTPAAAITVRRGYRRGVGPGSSGGTSVIERARLRMRS